jgi:hypothetical protein
LDHGYRGTIPRNSGYHSMIACAVKYGFNWWDGIAKVIGPPNPASPVGRDGGFDIRETSYSTRATALMAHLYPPHPARDGLGEARPFDATHHDAFQRMMAACGDPAALATKRRVVDAVLAGEPPTAMAGDRHGRISVRIALRQMKSQGHASAALSAWLASFDSAAPDEADDEAALHHEG